MAFIINTKGLVQTATPDIRETLGVILENMGNKRKRDSYSSYAQNLDFSSEHGKSRQIIGKALGYLWEYCLDNNLPWLNMLVVTKGSGIPGDGVMKWYEEHFASLADYDVYCSKHAELAELMLGNGCIKIQ